MKRSFGRKRPFSAGRPVSLLLALCLALLLGSCGGKPEKSLYAQGLELVSVMEEMAGSETYLSTLSSDDALTQRLRAVAAGNFSEPKAVYEIKLPESLFSELSGMEPEEVSALLWENLQAKAVSSVFNHINALGGVEPLAAAAMCTAGRSFVNSALKENIIYLYTYENAVPVAVTFLKGGDGAVSASGCFVLYEDFPTGSASEVAAALSDFSAQVQEVSP